jgi:hypothetical protein
VAAKRSKASVDYSAGKPHAHCGLCRHFEKPDACELVEGKIDPARWCNLFSARKSRARERYK